jgi:hypothetical protein
MGLKTSVIYDSPAFINTNRRLLDMRILLCVLFACMGATASLGQFTYIGVRTGYDLALLKAGYYSTMAHHQFIGGFDVLTRPCRSFGVGLSVEGGLLQKSTHHFDDGCNTCNWNSPNGSESRSRYVPNSFNYEMTRGTTVTARTRYFYNMRRNAYLGFDLSFFTFTESFLFSRTPKPAVWWGSGGIQYPAVSALNLSSSTKHTMVVPGFSIGAMPHIGKNVYMDISYILQVLKFNRPSFSYLIVNDWDSLNNTPKVSIVESPLKGTKLGHCFQLGLGYYF